MFCPTFYSICLWLSALRCISYCAVLSLSCQGKGRVSHWWFLWSSPSRAFSTANFLLPFSLYLLPLPISTLCTYITLTGGVDSIYWFPSMPMWMSFHLHHTVFPTSPTSVRMSLHIILPPSLPSSFCLSTAVICINQSGCQMVRRASRSPLWSIGNGEPSIDIVSSQSLSWCSVLHWIYGYPFSSSAQLHAHMSSQSKCDWAHKWGVTFVIEEIWTNVLSDLSMTNDGLTNLW